MCFRFDLCAFNTNSVTIATNIKTQSLSLQLVYCFLTTAYGTPGGLFTVGITLGLAWEIPSNPLSLLRESTAATVAALHRRDRRELYPKIETFLDK